MMTVFYWPSDRSIQTIHCMCIALFYLLASSFSETMCKEDVSRALNFFNGLNVSQVSPDGCEMSFISCCFQAWPV